MRRSWLSRRPPPALRSPRVRFDNLAIVPASLLPHQAAYQRYANRLPRGQILLIVPRNAEPAKREALAKVAATLQQHGRGVRTLPQERFRVGSAPVARQGQQFHPRPRG